jgi:hypothetical protein
MLSHGHRKEGIIPRTATVVEEILGPGDFTLQSDPPVVGLSLIIPRETDQDRGLVGETVEAWRDCDPGARKFDKPIVAYQPCEVTRGVRRTQIGLSRIMDYLSWKISYFVG